MEIDVDALKDLRQQRVWTIETLARESGVSKNTISKAERGGSVYPVTVHKLAAALEVEPKELLR